MHGPRFPVGFGSIGMTHVGPPLTWTHELDRLILVVLLGNAVYVKLNITTSDHELRSRVVFWSLHVSFMSWNPKSLIDSSEGSLMLVVVWCSVQNIMAQLIRRRCSLLLSRLLDLERWVEETGNGSV